MDVDDLEGLTHEPMFELTLGPSCKGKESVTKTNGEKQVILKWPICQLSHSLKPVECVSHVIKMQSWIPLFK